MATSEQDPDTATAEAEAKQKLNLQVKVDETSTCKRHVTVTVAREDIDRYFKEAFSEFVPKAEVPGFRPGRAPRKLVESRFREQMANQVKGSLLMDSVSQVSEEASFSAISEPDFDFQAVELPDDGPMTFEFDIEVRPEFDLPEWRGLKLTRPVHDYSDEEVNQHLKRLLTRYAMTTDSDEPAGSDDQVKLRITFRDGEQVLSELETEPIALKPVLSFSDGNIGGFDELVKGKKVGDRVTTKVTLSSEAEKEELRGKEVDAELEVLGVRHVAFPELTPSFLDKIGGFANEEELNEAVREELDRQLAYYQQRRIRQQITTQLIRGANWDLPEDMLRRQYRREYERAVLELRSSGFDDSEIVKHTNAIRQNSLNSTAAALKEHFILERIAEDQDIEAEDHDYESEIRSIAAQSQDSPRRVRARLEKRGQMDALRNQIVERKVIDLITSHAEFSDVPFEPSKDDTVAVDHSISGHRDDAEIPEAKYSGEAQELPGQDKK